jgi:putative ABC transport system permease protein
VSMLRRALLRDLRARRAQFIAVWATIVLGVALFGASYDAFQNLTSSYQKMYTDLAFADLTVSGGPADRIASDGAALPGVSATAVRSVGEGLIRFGDRAQLGRIVGLPPDGSPAVDRVLILRGHNISPSSPDEVLVEQHLATARGLEPGSTMEVMTSTGWRSVAVAGIVASPEYIWPARSRQEVIVPPDQWGVVFAPESLVAALPASEVHQEALFYLAADAPSGTLERLASLAVADGASSTQTRADQPSNAALQEDVSGFGEMSIMFPVMFLLAGALATAVLLGRMVASQRGQIGVLLANGFSSRAVMGHYLALGVVVGIAGSLPGAVLGGLFAAAISHLYTSMISVPITVIDVRPLTVLVGLLMGPLAGAAAAYLPARRASRISPAEAMRGAVPVGGVAIATTLVLVSWGMIDTVQILLDRQFVEVQRQDATVYLSAPVPASQVTAAVGVPGVAVAEPEMDLQAAIVNGDRRYATTLIGLETDSTLHRFIAPDGSRIALPSDGLLLGSSLQGLLGVSVGDTVEVDPGSGGAATIRLRVAGFVSEPFGTYAYASLGTAAGLSGAAAGDPTVSTVLVRYDTGADKAAVAGRLEALPAVAAVIDSRALYDLAQQFMGLFYVFMGVMLVLGGILAFALIFNTMTANVTERAAELAALRTLGMSRATVSRLVTGENLLLTLGGVAVGLVVGYAVAAEFMASFSSDLFEFDLQVRPTTFIFTALSIVVVGFISQWPALRAVGRIDLGRVVRERSV